MRPRTLAPSMLSIIVLSVCAISAQQPAAPSPMPTGLARVALGAKQRYDNIKRDIADSADAVPESEYSFKPTPQVRSFGELIGHVADVNAWYCAMANAENPDWSDKTEKTAKSKADLVKALKRHDQVRRGHREDQRGERAQPRAGRQARSNADHGDPGQRRAPQRALRQHRYLHAAKGSCAALHAARAARIGPVTAVGAGWIRR